MIMSKTYFCVIILIAALKLSTCCDSCDTVLSPERLLSLTERQTTSEINQHSKTVNCFLNVTAASREQPARYESLHFNPLLCNNVLITEFGFYSENDMEFVLETDSEKKKLVKKLFNIRDSTPTLKVILSVEISHPARFYFQLPTATNRIISSALVALRNFDGLDLRFPRHNSPFQQPGFTKGFFTFAREEFDTLNLDFSLTVFADNITAEREEVKFLATVLDQINFMSCHLEETSRTQHIAPMEELKNDINHIKESGVPLNKILVGIPAFGRSFLLINSSIPGPALMELANTGFQERSTGFPGIIPYFQVARIIITDRTTSTVYKDRKQNAVFIRKLAKWLSFETPKSCQDKASYVKENGLLGVALWALDMEDFRGLSGNKNPLLRGINFGLS